MALSARDRQSLSPGMVVSVAPEPRSSDRKGLCVWLNWVLFELVVNPPLLTCRVTLDMIRSICTAFSADAPIAYETFVSDIAPILSLTPSQRDAWWQLLCTLVVCDEPVDALLDNQMQMADPERVIRSSRVCVTDVAIVLFAFYLKRRYSSGGETRANLERMPASPSAAPPAGGTKRLFSASTPIISPVLIAGLDAQSGRVCQFRKLFVQQFAAFFAFYSDGWGEQHSVSLNLLLHVGPGSEVRFERYSFARESVLAIAQRVDVGTDGAVGAIESPVAYRVPCPFPRRGEGTVPDRPVIVEGVTGEMVEQRLDRFPEVFVSGCRRAQICLVGAARGVYVTKTRDTTVFVGAAAFVRVTGCSKLRLIAAAKMVSVDACQGSTCYLVVNSRPIVTGWCARVAFGPYCADYDRFGIDALTLGINPRLNMWNAPIVIGESRVALVAPADFVMWSAPVTEGVSPTVMPDLPPEFVTALLERRAAFEQLQADLAKIKARDPDLCAKIIGKLRELAPAAA